MRRMTGCVLAVLTVFSMSAAAMAATAVPCSSGLVRTVETISFATPLCYMTISDAYTSWYSADIHIRNLAVADAALVFDFSPDGQVTTLHGGDDDSWNQTADFSTVPGPLAVSGNAAVAFEQIIIR